MLKIVLATAALAIVTGTAFAGSDHFNPNTAQPATVDSSMTASVRKPDFGIRKQVDTRIKTGAVTAPSPVPAPMEYGQGIWGH